MSGETRITLNDLMTVASAKTLCVAARMGALIPLTWVDTSDLAQWSQLSEMYGEREVIDVSPEGNALHIVLAERGEG